MPRGRSNKPWYLGVLDDIRPSMGNSSREAPPDSPAPFESHDRLLETARQMFRARGELLDAMSSGEEISEKLIENEDKWRRYWHGSFENTGDIAICKRCNKSGLNAVEREIVALLLLEKLGLVRNIARTVSDIIESLGLNSADAMSALRSLDDTGRLVREKLIFPCDSDIDIGNRAINLDPLLIDAAIRGVETSPGWPVASEEELYEYLLKLTQALASKIETCRGASVGFESVGEFLRWSRKVEYNLRMLEDTLDLHPDWKLYKIKERLNLDKLWIPFISLLGKELGHLGPDHSLFTGDGLVRATMHRTSGFKMFTERFIAAMRSGLDRYIRPCGGQSDFLSSNHEELAETEFEITDKSREILGLEIDDSKRWRGKHSILREPVMRLDQLVLTEETKRALDMAIVHARRSDRLMKDWGLGGVIAYGTGATLLFHGPPGTGKTSAAEGIAHELGRQIIVADYARLQNFFVGETEKNIVKTFRQAALHKAVLFWDEADAMMINRERALHGWESRQVNVILQEVERFEGVCILATNRRSMLDPAFERRISLKVSFRRPDSGMRSGIWRKLIPADMPVAGDLDIARLSEYDLSGGEIKNAVLNAARAALQRCEDGPVTMDDFLRAIRIESEEKWTREGKGRMGFRT